MERERPSHGNHTPPKDSPSTTIVSRNDALDTTSSMLSLQNRESICPTSPDPSDSIGSPRTSRRLPIQTYLSTFPEWHRPERITSLYSSLERFKPGSEYSGNEFAYKTNLRWWIKVILGSARRGLLSTYQPTKPIRFYTNEYSPSISSTYGVADTEPTGSSLGVLEIDEDIIVARFTKGGQRPVCIKTVINEMQQQGLIVPRSEYLPWGGLGMPAKMIHLFIKVPISWSLRRLNIGSPVSSTPKAYTSIGLASARFDSRKDSTQNGRIGLGIGLGGIFGGSPTSRGPMPDKETYVILDSVKEAAERILQLHEQSSQTYYKSDNLMTFADFRELFSRRALEQLALHGDVPLSSSSSIGHELILTDRDLEIVIRALQYDYHALITGPLDSRKPATELTDREFIIKFIDPGDNKELAPVDRGTIELREMGRKLQGQVHDLEHRVQEIQTAQSDVEILQTLEKGSQTLKDVLAQKNENGEQILSLDNIENTMDQLADILADQDEVDEAVRNANELVTPQVDEADLLDELDRLARSSSVEISPSPQDTEMKLVEKTTTVQTEKVSTPGLGSSAQCRSASPIPTSASTKESPSSAHSLSMKAKRVAEPIDQTVKQRKLSQENEFIKRESDGHEPLSDTLPSDHEDIPTIGSPSLEHNDQSTLSRKHTPTLAPVVESMQSQPLPDDQPTKMTDELDQEDEAELNALMMELNDLKAPDAPIAKTPNTRQRQESQAMLLE
ncbi:hypothetical protein BGW42_004114 [Actinomortierella wolfii]|nr:hypothetical protein BGW42_004114 [Actinomortierella wolfii]